MGAAVIALGAFAVWVELVLRATGIYVALFFLPLGFASLVWPSTRRWFGRLVKALAALILSKFVIVAVIALAAAALGNFSGPEGSGFGGVVAGSALMLMAAFSPLVLFRLADTNGGPHNAAAALGEGGRRRPDGATDAQLRPTGAAFDPSAGGGAAAPHSTSRRPPEPRHATDAFDAPLPDPPTHE